MPFARIGAACFFEKGLNWRSGGGVRVGLAVPNGTDVVALLLSHQLQFQVPVNATANDKKNKPKVRPAKAGSQPWGASGK